MWINAILNYVPKNEQEEIDKQRMLEAYSIFQDSLLTRENPFMHFTSSSMILNEEHTKVLMVYHNIYKSFSWTGGHNDKDADFLHVAKKEAMEETGIHEPKLIQNGICSLEILPVKPHLKHGKYISAHIHLNVSYLFESKESEKLTVKEDENSNVKWIAIEKLDSFISQNDIEMLPVYKKILSRL